MAKKAAPSAQALPTLEHVRHATLDRLCEAIGEDRDIINARRASEQENCREALDEMHHHGVTSYHFAGVELVRVPGQEKLRVRTSKEDATRASEE